MNSTNTQRAELTRLDHIILQYGGKTNNTERLPIFLEKSKHEQALSFEELQRDIGRLREEVAFHQEAQQALMTLFSDTREVYRLLRDALQKASPYYNEEPAFLELAYSAQDAGLLIRHSLQKASQRLSSSEGRLLQAFGIILDDTSGKDYSIL
jgi:predicted RNA-binding Zn ribbon-like protein